MNQDTRLLDPFINFVNQLDQKANLFDSAADYVMAQTQLFDLSALRTLFAALLVLYTVLCILSASLLVVRKANTFKQYIALKDGLIRPNGPNILAFGNIVLSCTSLAFFGKLFVQSNDYPNADFTLWCFGIGAVFIPQFLAGWLYVLSCVAIHLNARHVQARFNQNPPSDRRLRWENVIFNSIMIMVLLGSTISLSTIFGQGATMYATIRRLLLSTSKTLQEDAVRMHNATIVDLAPYLTPLSQADSLARKLAQNQNLGFQIWTGLTLLPVMTIVPFTILHIRMLKEVTQTSACTSQFVYDCIRLPVAIQQPEMYQDLVVLLIAVLCVAIAALMYTPFAILAQTWTWGDTKFVQRSLYFSQLGFLVVANLIALIFLVVTIRRRQEQRSRKERPSRVALVQAVRISPSRDKPGSPSEPVAEGQE